MRKIYLIYLITLLLGCSEDSEIQYRIIKDSSGNVKEEECIINGTKQVDPAPCQAYLERI